MLSPLKNTAVRAGLCAASAIAVLFVSGAATASDAPLTLARAQQLAVGRSQLLVAKDRAVGSARDMAAAAGHLPDPVLKAGIDNLPLSGMERYSLSRESMTMRRIGVMQEITSSDKLRLRAQRFEREAEKSQAEKDVALAAIQRDTALAWLDSYYADTTAALVAQQVSQAKLEIEAADAAYRSGRGSQADVFGARRALVELEDRASESRRMATNARVILRRWIGNAADGTLAGKPQMDSVRHDPEALESSLAHHPELAVLDVQEAIARTEANLARANRKSDWSVEVAYQKRGSAFSDMLSIGVSVPLQWNRKGRQDRELAASVALTEQARAEREEAARVHVAEVRTMLNEWQDNRARQARLERELVPLATSGVAAATAAYRGGKASLAEVLAARGAELEARLQVLQLEAATARLWAQLTFLFPQDAAATSSAHPNMDSK